MKRRRTTPRRGLWLAVVLVILPGILFAQNKSIRLRNQQIQTEPSRPRPQSIAAPDAASPAKGLFLIQFDGPVREDWRQQVEALGVELLRYVPDDAFIVRLNGVPPGRLHQLPFVRWTGNYHAKLKVHDQLQASAARMQAPSSLPVTVLLAPRTSTDEIDATRRMMQKVDQESRLGLGTVLRGRINAAQLNALADSEAVLWIEPAPQMRLFDEESSKIVGGDDGLRTTPTLTQQLGYDGRGVVVAVADSGLHAGNAETMHPDLAGRVDAFFYYGTLDDASDGHSHGTHVAGIIAGNGAIGETDSNGALYGLGVASGARIVVQRIFDSFGTYEPPPSFETLTRHATSAGAVIGNNSWGDDVNGRYDVSAAEFDELVRDANFLEPGDQPYILEFSAGNAGPSARTIGTPALAKNVIATGASLNNRDDLFIYTEGQETMADFSSRGPCEDGRIKPDVVAPGTWIASLRSIFADDNNAWAEISQNYMYQGGTSQSGPHVSGAAAVFVQYYRENFGGTPSPALVKAALINSAVDMLDEFGTAPAPNNEEGWGRIDLTRIIDSDRDVVFIEQTNVLSTGASYETAVVVEDPSEPLKVTLTYTDEPGFPGAIPALVNDLDLEVIAPDGTLYRGNRFSNGESIPNAATPDNINNVEGVFLFEPLVGEYRIRVFARNVPEDARIDTPAVDQDFALVISGAFLPPGQSVVYLDRTYYRVPDRIHVGVVDRDRAGSPFVSVTLTSTTEPGGQNLLLFPETPNGVFTNSIVTATGAPAADNQLQIAHGDLIQARYQDDSTGALRIASAEADLVPPIISAVTVTNRFGRATILWNTDELTDSRVDYGTTAALGLSTGDLELTTSHTIGLENLIPLATYFFQVVSKDRAGNVTTNNNGGAMYSLVAPAPPPVLIVDGFYDDLLLAPAPPLSEYTNTLNQLGVSYDVWDHRNQGSPELADLRPYRVVMWRVAEFSFTYPTFTEEEQQTIREYLNAGGSLFVASMEVLSRLDELGGSDGPAFRRDILKVPSLVVDAELPSVSGVPGDLIGDGLHFVLDHPPAIFGSGDFSDTIVPSGDAVGILTDDVSDGFAGLRYPRVGVDSPWRLVFLPFLLEAIPANGTPPNTRAEFLNRVLQFLAPGFNGVAVVTLDRAAYGLPSEMIVEVGDADVAGAGQITVTALSTTEPAGKTFVLEETPRPGLFRGLIPILSSTNPPSADYLRANPNDLVTVRFFDSSSGKNVEDTAVIDIVTPQIFDVGSEPDYSTAIIYWETDEASDSLVQFGESLPLPINRTEFDPTMTLYHEVTLAGLQPDRSYYYQVVSRDSAGNAVIDNNGGQYYTFTTLKPLTPPLMDTFETGATNWSVFSNDESETQWALGVPRNGVETAAHSPTNAWGSSLRGRPASLVDTFLISPAIHLTNGNVFTLRFWHSYDFSERSQFDLLEGGEILLVESDGNRAIALATYFDGNFEWEEEEIDLSQYSGKVIYLVWHHVLLSFDFLPRPGWLVDDVQILVDNIVPGTVTVTNNLSQASFILTGPTSRNGVGRWLQITNAPPGQYVVTFGNVPYCFTPPSQTNTLAPGGTLVFNGVYSFPDANANGISDLWEQAFFGGAAPTDDPDGDAASNYAEFMAGTNPTNSASRLGLSVSKQPNNLIRLEWPASPGRAYRLLSSTNMTVWTPGEWTRASGSAMSSLLPAPQAPTFYRVEVQP